MFPGRCVEPVRDVVTSVRGRRARLPGRTVALARQIDPVAQALEGIGGQDDAMPGLPRSERVPGDGHARYPEVADRLQDPLHLRIRLLDRLLGLGFYGFGGLAR